MGCIELMDYKILLSRTSFKEGREYIQKHFKDIYEVEPGYKLFDVYLIGVSPIFLATDDNHVIFPYVKPCHGTFILRIEDEDEAKRLTEEKKVK
jgi:hypothetical protein